MNNTIFLMFTMDDMVLCLFSIVMGFLGGMADHILRRDDLINLPQKEPVPMKFDRYFPLFLGRITIGAFAGLMVFLLMIGTMLDNKEAIAKLFLLAGIAGFVAPSFAKKYQDKITGYFVEISEEK